MASSAVPRCGWRRSAGRRGRVGPRELSTDLLRSYVFISLLHFHFPHHVHSSPRGSDPRPRPVRKHTHAHRFMGHPHPEADSSPLGRESSCCCMADADSNEGVKAGLKEKRVFRLGLNLMILNRFLEEQCSQQQIERVSEPAFSMCVYVSLAKLPVFFVSFFSFHLSVGGAMFPC